MKVTDSYVGEITLDGYFKVIDISRDDSERKLWITPNLHLQALNGNVSFSPDMESQIVNSGDEVDMNHVGTIGLKYASEGMTTKRIYYYGCSVESLSK